LVRLARVRRDTSRPLATTRYDDSVLIAIRYVALSAGWSLHGNQVAAPQG
jgi:hypothetical protein